MASQQSGNDCWTALDSGSPKWAPVDPKVPETFTKSKTFSLTGACSHPDIKSAQDGRPFSTDVALFGVSAAKLLALRSPKPSEQDEDFVLSNFIDIQDWTTLYLQEKVASLSLVQALPFDPKVPFVLLQILDNVYDVAMSLVDFFVEAAVKNAKQREDGQIEVEDFACVDFDFILSSLNPLHCEFGYRLKDISDIVFEDSICRTCGKARDGRAPKPKAGPSRKKKPAPKPAKNNTPVSTNATPSSSSQQKPTPLPAHVESISQMVKPAPTRSRRKSVRLAENSGQHVSNASSSQVTPRPAVKVAKTEPESDVALLAHPGMRTTISASDWSLINAYVAPMSPQTICPTPRGPSPPIIMTSGLPERAMGSPMPPPQLNTVDQKGKRKASTESPAVDVDDGAEASILMPPPVGLPPFYTSASTSGLKFKLPRPGDVVGQITPLGSSSVRVEDPVPVVKASQPGDGDRTLQKRTSE